MTPVLHTAALIALMVLRNRIPVATILAAVASAAAALNVRTAHLGAGVAQVAATLRNEGAAGSVLSLTNLVWGSVPGAARGSARNEISAAPARA